MIKILHFISDTNVGGAGNLLCEQIRGLDKRKFEISVALPMGSMLIKKLSSLSCKIIECKEGANQSFSIKGVIEAHQIIKKICPDIVHSHGSLSSRIAATLLFIPCRVFTKHCAPPLPQAMTNPIAKQALGTVNNILSTSIIATAECARKNLIDMGCDAKKISTIVNGVTPLRYLSDGEKAFLRAKYGLNKNDFVISIIARLEEEKGHQTLLRAAKICKNQHPNFRFFIVGSGSYESALKKYAYSLGVDDIVRFSGFCDDVAPILNISDLNVNCSYVSETSSLSLSEGMSIGIPCIASDVGGNTHMVNNMKNGILFERQNHKALASAIIRLYLDKSLYKKCSLAALERYSTEFNNKIMCDKMTNFYIREYRRSKNRLSCNNIFITQKIFQLL